MNRLLQKVPVLIWTGIYVGSATAMSYISYQERLKREMYAVKYSHEYSEQEQRWIEESGVGRPEERYFDEEQFRNSDDLEIWLNKKKEKEATLQIDQLIIKRPGSFFFESK